MQLLESLQIVNGTNATSELTRNARIKANLQHIEDVFNSAFSAPFFSALLNAQFLEVLGKR